MTVGIKIKRIQTGQFAGDPEIDQWRGAKGADQARVVWNPDDGRFYVERMIAGEDWEHVATFAGDAKGMANAIQYVRRNGWVMD